MNKTLIILVVIILIFASFLFGFFINQKGVQTIPSSSFEAQQLEKLSNSEMLQSITYVLSGEVLEINGEILTLGKNGESVFSAKVNEETAVNFITPKISEDEIVSSETEVGELSSIKVGDEVTIVSTRTILDGIDFVVKSINVIVQED